MSSYKNRSFHSRDNSKRSQQPGPLQPRKEPNCVRISTRHTSEIDDDENGGFRRYLPTDMANAKIRSALLSIDTTKDAQVAGVGTTKTGYVIRFRDAQSAEMARSNTAWLEELGNETKLVKPRFGIVVHRVPTEDFDLEFNKKEGIEKILAENKLDEKGFEIEDIAWLKKKDRPLGQSASLGIWFNTPEAANSVIKDGFLVGQRYIGSVESYRVELKRCHRC
ncbi:Putative Zinc knuckle domain protein [Aspergillus calidoustus]|uniref:Putative Zinc knuckle domain protein n=1 Tax=Aspergillus calidoustus TaxID=454130 RepID=A0A0U5GH60_ASPCI|nr:Putative Zinc knuckle domain protein [Aspergillus calidoustus]